MKRIRTSIHVAAALSLALGAAACKKETKKEEAPAGETGEQATKTTETATPVPAGEAAAPAVPLAHMPADAEVILSISFADARSSGLWKKYEDRITQGMGEDAAELEAACGVDPFSKINALTVAGNTKDESKSLVAVSGMDRATFEKCSEGVAKQEKKTFKAEEKGELVQYTMDDEVVLAAWLSDDQVLIGVEKADEAWMTARAQGKDGLAADSELLTMAGKADQSATLWFAAKPTADSPLGEGLGSTPAGKAQGFYGSLDFGDGLGVDVGVAYATPEEASTAATQLQAMIDQAKQSMPPVAKYVGKAKLGAEASDLVFNLDLSATDIDELVTMASAMIPGLAPSAPAPAEKPAQ